MNITKIAQPIVDSLRLRSAIVLIGVSTLPMLPACAENKEQAAGNSVAQSAEVKAHLAKYALLDLARSDPIAFRDLEPDRMEKLPLEKKTADTFQWGAFVINVRKLTFSADVHIATCWWFYNGEFEVNKAGRWTAKITNTIHAQEPFPDTNQ